MSNLQLAGFILFVVGLVPFTIGGLIFLRHGYDTWNAELLADKGLSWWDRKLGFQGLLTHPKSRWWCAIGFPICLAGFVLLVVSTIPLDQLVLFVVLFAAFFGLRHIIANRHR
ncbi:hypothetical protein DPM33_13945 [Mesorhizobium hawassense]|uniref:DUF3784 domain-containing protein n=1 Tax=Mesorhizobium hawassense TaxID=1209954 RepID=A0A330I0T1_9HYPH|nr:hypothetical protein [Mesorhizobium hawassense]RAZ90597.1 hypothetical protein DPM33_13945 [Mesorhizobium hawassense]